MGTLTNLINFTWLKVNAFHHMLPCSCMSYTHIVDFIQVSKLEIQLQVSIALFQVGSWIYRLMSEMECSMEAGTSQQDLKAAFETTVVCFPNLSLPSQQSV